MEHHNRRNRIAKGFLLTATAIASIALVTTPAAGVFGGGEIERVSVSSAGSEGNSDSTHAAMSASGRIVAFTSNSSNLVTDDTNGAEDVFVHDRDTGMTERVSLSSQGVQGDANSLQPTISKDGRYVAFESAATNLVAGDVNGLIDVFVHDRQTRITELVSVSTAGIQGNAPSVEPVVSADGRYVAFYSHSNHLVPGDTNMTFDVFVRDLQLATTERASVSSAGTQGNGASSWPTISSDGRFVAFHSGASNLVPDDTNGQSDVLVHDRRTGRTVRVSVDSFGTEGNAHSVLSSISGNGRLVAFQSAASNLVSEDTNSFVDVFVHDVVQGLTERVSVRSDGSQGNSNSYDPRISLNNGRYVSFSSDASNLVSGDTNGFADIFVRDRLLGRTGRASIARNGPQANNGSFNSDISPGGHYIAFDSSATNLDQGDANGSYDVFVRTH